MSYDVYLEIDTGADEPTEVASRDHTSNCSPMWSHALTETGAPASQLGVLIEETPAASELGPILAKAVAHMREHPGDYEAMNPANGWGSYESALEFLDWLSTGCAKHSKCTVRVWR